MKIAGLIICFLSLFSNCFGQEIQKNESETAGNSFITLSGKVISFDKNQLKLEFTIENKGSEIIYIAANPQQLFGKFGYYLSLEEDISNLQISSRVFPMYPGLVYSNNIRVELKPLASGEKYSDQIVVKFPAKETIPPYTGGVLKEKKILPEHLRRIDLSIGYFVKEEGLTHFLQGKTAGWYVKGENEISKGVNKGKTLLETQKLTAIGFQLSEFLP